jgi:hypothetical protein
VKVTGFGELPLPDGAMINGIITDADLTTRFLSHVNDTYGLRKEPAYLVIDSNNILSKTMDVPPLAESKVLGIIASDMTHFQDNQEDPNVYDFTVVNPKSESGGVTILAVGVDRSMLEDYRTTMISAGFDLKGINIGINCQIKLAKFLPELKTGTAILAQVDGRIMTLTLFEDGKYLIGNKYRLMNTEDTPEWYAEISNNLSSMVQFNKGQHANGEISSACFAGLSQIQLGTMASNLSYLGIDIRPIGFDSGVSLTGKAAGQDGFDPGHFLLNIGNLLKV